jgi:hypothetical protein
MRAEATKKRQTSWLNGDKGLSSLKNLPAKKAKNDRRSNGALVLAENKELMDLATDLVAKASGLAARLSQLCEARSATSYAR